MCMRNLGYSIFRLAQFIASRMKSKIISYVIKWHSKLDSYLFLLLISLFLSIYFSFFVFLPGTLGMKMKCGKSTPPPKPNTNHAVPYPSIGEHPAAMQHNFQPPQFVLQPMMVALPVATIATHRAAISTNFTATTVTIIIASISGILHKIWIALARFRKNLFNSMLWLPSASVWIARWKKQRKWK